MNSFHRHDLNSPDAERPDVPFLRTWRGVYKFVLVVFVATVALLTWFSRAFS